MGVDYNVAMPESVTALAGANAGVQADAARRDHIHGIQYAIAVTSVGPTDVVGTQSRPAREDHKHGLAHDDAFQFDGDILELVHPTEGLPDQVSDTGSRGSNNKVSRFDHRHALTVQDPLYWINATTLGAQGSLTGDQGPVGPAGPQGDQGPKDAILPYKGEFVQMACIEASEVILIDRYEFEMKDTAVVRVRDEMLHICEPGLFPVSIVARDGSTVRLSRDGFNFVLDRVEDSKTTVWMMIGGIRKGMKQQFARKSRKDYEANLKFWQKSRPH